MGLAWTLITPYATNQALWRFWLKFVVLKHLGHWHLVIQVAADTLNCKTGNYTNITQVIYTILPFKQRSVSVTPWGTNPIGIRETRVQREETTRREQNNIHETSFSIPHPSSRTNGWKWNRELNILLTRARIIQLIRNKSVDVHREDRKNTDMGNPWSRAPSDAGSRSSGWWVWVV